MQLREATTDDVRELVEVQRAGAVLALEHIFAQETHPFPVRSVIRRWFEELQQPGTHVYVATGFRVALEGFAATRGTELLHFGTAPRSWGTGFAGAVHAAVLERVAQTAPEGAQQLWLRVFAQNARARRFYEKVGWSATPTRTRSTFPPYPELVRYERALTR